MHQTPRCCGSWWAATGNGDRSEETAQHCNVYLLMTINA
jgi:hypothetical protein